MGTKGFVIKNGILEEYTAKGGDVVIPSGVTGILGTAFFKKGSAVTSVSIPDSVVSIGLGAFDCMNLEEIRVDPGNHHLASDNGVLFNKDKTILIRCPCGKSGTYSIAVGVTKIENRAFRSCKNLTGVSISKSVNSIGDEAFRDCSSLTDITIPESVTQIGTSTFLGCEALTMIRLPERLVEIKSSTFFGCRNLNTVLIPEGVTSIGDSAFAYCEKLTDLSIPEIVTAIGDGAFSHCNALEDENGFIIISGILFGYCGAGGDLTIPVGVTKIAKNAFNGCRELTTISMPDGLESIGEYAFYNCSGLTSLTIPEGVTHIGEMAFVFCSHLMHVSILESVQEIAKDVFPENKDMRISIPDISRLPAQLRMNALLCYAEDGGKRDHRYESHCKYIKANCAKLVDQAISYQPLLELMYREKLITPKSVELYVEAAQKSGKAELIAMMLDYQANKISDKQKENVEKRKEKEQDTIFDRTVARQGKEGIAGLNIAVSGKLDTFVNREELKAFILEKGGQLVSSLTAKVDYLIVNDPDSDSGKAQKAWELGIEIISERYFNELSGRLLSMEDRR